MIKPAMSAEDWANVSYMEFGCGNDELTDDPHACAAACLRDKSFGFTRRMLSALTDLLDEVDLADEGPPGEGWRSAKRDGQVALVEMITERIEALLPPETKDLPSSG